MLAEHVCENHGSTVPLRGNVDEVVRLDEVRNLLNPRYIVVEPELGVDYPMELLHLLLAPVDVVTTSGSGFVGFLHHILLANPEGLATVLNLIEFNTCRAGAVFEFDTGGTGHEIQKGAERKQEAFGHHATEPDSLNTTVVFEQTGLLLVFVQYAMPVKVSKRQKLRVDTGHGREVNELTGLLIDAYDYIVTVNMSDLQSGYLRVSMLGESVNLHYLAEVVYVSLFANIQFHFRFLLII
jgi:hypothetical protein